MRPISITLEGVASFTEAQTLDFTSLGSLFCISGRTGSGKSTILESIVIALYGRSGGKGNLGDYVNTKLDKARICFSFTAKGSIFEVTREFYREAKKQGKAVLKKDGKIIADKITEINTMIEEVVGLCREDFTQVILLEQGQFNKFLSADKSERTKTVGNLFRLNRFKDVYARFRERRSSLNAEAENLVKQLARFESDTQEYADKLLADSLEAKERSGALGLRIEAEEKQKGFFDAQREQAEREAETIKTVQKNTALYNEALIKRQELVKAEQEAKTFSVQAQKKREELDALKKKLAGLELFSVEELEAKRGQLGALRKRYTSAVAEEKKLIDEVSSAKRSLDEQRTGYARALSELGRLTDVSDYEARREEISKRLAEAARLNGELDEMHKEIAEETKKSEAYTQTLALLIGEINSLTESSQAVQSELKTLKEQRENIISKNAAATVAAGLKKGDVCPVCGGVFTHADVEIADLAEGEKKIEKAEERLREITQKLRLTENGNATYATKKSETDSKLKALYKRSEECKKTLSGLLRSGAEDIKAAEALLAEANPYALKEKEDGLKILLTKLEGAGADKASLEREGKILRSALNEYESKISELSGGIEYSVAVKQARERIAALTAELEEHEKLLASIAEEEKAVLPVISTLKALIEADSARIKGVSFDEEGAKSNAERLLQLSAQREEAIRLSAAAQATREGVLKNLKVKMELEAEHKRASDRAADLAIIAELLIGDKFLEFVAEEYIERFTQSASEILSSLTGGKFRLYYEGGTGNYYVKDFLAGGELRKVSTLSGGENFLASLAIAIAISREIAAFSEFEFFFLDEGFGTLDNEILDTVLEALFTLSGETTVGIITHCDALTDNIPDIVTVQHATETSGSKIIR